MKFDILEESGVSILSLEDPILYFENEGNNALQSTGMYSFIPQSVLRQAHSLCQSEFSTKCDLPLPLSISRILPFP